MAGLGLRGLGAQNVFRGCVSAADSEGNPVLCNDPNAVVWMDADGNAVPAGTPGQSAGSFPAIQTGSLSLFSAALPWLGAAALLLLISKRR
jgi:hypothetical protein